MEQLVRTVPSPPAPLPLCGRGGRSILSPARRRERLWSAEAKLPPNAEATLQHSTSVSASLGLDLPRQRRGRFFSRVVRVAGGTPAFPARRLLGARASRSHVIGVTVLGNRAGECARQKTYPFEPRQRGRNNLIRVQQSSVEFLGQVQLSQREHRWADALSSPHPLCPPLPRGGRGGGRTAVRPYTSLSPDAEATLQHSKRLHTRLPSPTLWERGWG